MRLLRPTPWHDVAGGLLLAAACLAAGPVARRRFVVGTLLGLAWELPLAAARPPLVVDLQPWPLPVPTQPLVHALWDGGLLTLGQALTGRQRRRRDLLVVATWGSAQEVVAELVGNGRVWQWRDGRRWVPQAAWLVLPVLHHGLLGRLETGNSAPCRSSGRS